MRRRPKTWRGLIRSQNWPWTSVGRGITPLIKCGASWIPPCGTHAKPMGGAPNRVAGQTQKCAGRSRLPQTIDDLLCCKHQTAESPAWFQQKHPQSSLKCVAYFSMEYMLSEALPIYSGGLGNVAGDQLKAASDLGVPVVGVGLLYQQGYFRQVIDKDGAQQALYPYNDPGQLPVTPLRQPNGEWLRWRSRCPAIRYGCGRGRCKSPGEVISAGQ